MLSQCLQNPEIEGRATNTAAGEGQPSQVVLMWGALVRIRKCSSASLESGTDRNCVSTAVSAVALRKPKIAVFEPEDAGAAGALPGRVEEAENRRPDERRAAKKTFIGSDVKVSKVAHALVRVV